MAYRGFRGCQPSWFVGRQPEASPAAVNDGGASRVGADLNRHITSMPARRSRLKMLHACLRKIFMPPFAYR